MGETLASGSAAVEAVGLHVGVDMTSWWSADDAVFSILRDRDGLLHIVAECSSWT
jgi:ParB family chromosome partitioning protein